MCSVTQRRIKLYAIFASVVIFCSAWAVLYTYERLHDRSVVIFEASLNSTRLQHLFSSYHPSNKPHPQCPKILQDILPFGQYEIPNDAPDFPIAFTIVAHREFARLTRLLRLIYRPQNSYCIHIDKRSTPEYRLAIENLLSCFGPNVHLIPTDQSVKVQWGDASVFEPQLVCAKSLLSADSKWRYLVNCVGQEFPLRTNREMVAVLKALNGSNLIETTDNSQHWRLGGNTPPFQVV